MGRVFIWKYKIVKVLKWFALNSSWFSEHSSSLQDVEWLRSATELPVLIKGVLTHEDGKVMTCFAELDLIILFEFLKNLKIQPKFDWLRRYM